MLSEIFQNLWNSFSPVSPQRWAFYYLTLDGDMAKIKQKTKKAPEKRESPFQNYWNKTNIILIAIGAGLLLLGFYFMNFTPYDNPVSLSYSPVVLLIAYLVIFPVSILYKKK